MNKRDILLLLEMQASITASIKLAFNSVEVDEDEQQEMFSLEQKVESFTTEIDRQKRLQDNGYANDVPSVLAKMHDANASIKALTVEIDRIQERRKADYYQISESTFLYHKQILTSKGLLSDNHTGNFIGGKTFTYMSLTVFGERFIKFIINS